ncbi:MAG: Rrf2 family transcriptional regulator [bacterium]|nr:Rrf2 family transcriptional regulator [bacterium]
MVKISQKTRYAVRALIRLSTYGNEGTTLKQISFKENIPLKFLEQIFAALVKAGILESKRGAEGGYRLKKELSDITLYEVMRALKEDVKLARCFEFVERECPFSEYCSAEAFWKELQNRITKIFEETTLGRK